MGLRVFRLTFTMLFSASAFAENSFWSTSFNQVSHERYCDQVSNKDLNPSDFKCRSDIPGRALAHPWELYEDSVFQVAAEKQTEKNKCLNEQITALLSNPKLYATWRSQLAASWLGIKKAELTLERCEQEVNRRVSPEKLAQFKKDHEDSLRTEIEYLPGKKTKIKTQNTEDTSLRKAYDQTKASNDLGINDRLEPLEKKWEDLCFNEKKLGALRAAKELFQFSLPIISEPDFFVHMEHNRKLIINKNTGKPITNDEILKSDLRDLSFIKLKRDEKRETQPIIDRSLDGRVRKSLTDRVDERARITQKIKSAEKEGYYSLDQDLKDYIFEDDTLYDTLISKKLLNPGYTSLDMTKSDDPKSKINHRGSSQKRESEKVPVSLGAFCILSRYEPNMTGEIVGLMAESTISIGVAMKLMKSGFFLKEMSRDLSKGQKITRDIKYGTTAASIPALTEQLAKSCPIPIGMETQEGKTQTVTTGETFRTKKIVSHAKNEKSISDKAQSLPDDVGYDQINIEMDSKLIPSCKSTQTRNFMLNETFSPNCFLDALTFLAPI